MVSTTAKMRCCSRNGSCSISAESMEAREAAVFSTTSAKIWSAEAPIALMMAMSFSKRGKLTPRYTAEM